MLTADFAQFPFVEHVRSMDTTNFVPPEGQGLDPGVMWRSTSWNGLDPAIRNATLAGIGLVLLHLPSSAWSSADAHMDD